MTAFLIFKVFPFRSYSWCILHMYMSLKAVYSLLFFVNISVDLLRLPSLLSISFSFLHSIHKLFLIHTQATFLPIIWITLLFCFILDINMKVMDNRILCPSPYIMLWIVSTLFHSLTLCYLCFDYNIIIWLIFFTFLVSSIISWCVNIYKIVDWDVIVNDRETIVKSNCKKSYFGLLISWNILAWHNYISYLVILALLKQV